MTAPRSAIRTDTEKRVSPYQAHIAAVVAAAPPLTPEQEARIRGLFRPGVASLPAMPLAA